MKTLEEIKQDLESNVGAGFPRPNEGQGNLASTEKITNDGASIIVPKEIWLETAKFLKESPEYKLDFLSSVTGVDYKDYLEAVYHLYSIEKKEGPLQIKVRTDREKSLVPSVTPIWRSAEFQEREAYDLVGIHFEGHPDLRRILMWDEFQYHPLRKDYVMEDQDREL